LDCGVAGQRLPEQHRDFISLSAFQPVSQIQIEPEEQVNHMENTISQFYVRRGRFKFAWRVSLRLVGVLAVGASLFGVSLGLLLTTADAQGSYGLPGFTVRVVEMIVVLVIALQAAFAFAPDDEPSLELLVVAPRPLYFVLIERLTLILLMHGAVALAAGVVGVLWLKGDNLLLATARWLPPSLMLMGVAVRATLVTRRGSFGMLVVIMLWVLGVVGANVLLYMYPDTWFIQPFLQPTDVTTVRYAVNRIVVSVVGLGLIGLSAWLVNDDERVLNIK
jgi:hypothetical protein